MVTSEKHIPVENEFVLGLRAEMLLPEHKTPVELDDLDLVIIEAQQKDPFFSYADLAEEQGVTSATVRNRIKRLKASGVIDVVTIINPYKVGYDTFALIGVKIKSHANPDQLVHTLQSIPGISSVIMVAGNFDFFVLHVCRNLEEYRRFIVENLRSIPEIASFESYVGLDLYDRKFLVGVVVG